MRLYLVRHGIPVDAGADSDGDRWLTDPGRRLARATFDALAGEAEAPALVLASPLVRAVQTAELLLAAFRADGPLRIEPALASGSAGAVLARIEAEPAPSLALVGHEPLLSTLGAHLLGLPSYPLAFERSAVLALELAGRGAARLAFLLHPAASGREPRLARSF